MSISLVPGFGQRYPKEDDDPLLPTGEIIRPPVETVPDCHSLPSVAAQPDNSCHSRLDRESQTDRPVHRSQSFFIETCCTTLEEAVAAEARGASRIELCADLSVGGLTPPRELISEVVSRLSIPVNVLIRPSAGDFVYDEADLQQMISDMEYCKSVGVAGIVVGVLTPEGNIDIAAMRRLVAAARPLPVTFHRAFDVCTEDPFTALDKIIALGCARLLSSGQAPTAWDGRNLLNLLVRRLDLVNSVYLHVFSHSPVPSTSHHS